MRRVYVDEDGLMLEYIKNVLTQEGIHSITRNFDLAGAVGELPPQDCYPEVWILDDKDYDRASRIVEAMCRTVQLGPWNCGCGENVEGQFTECWNCGASRPDD